MLHSARPRGDANRTTVDVVATLLQEQDDEWQVMDRRYYGIQSMCRIDSQREGGETPKELLAAIAESR